MASTVVRKPSVVIGLVVGGNSIVCPICQGSFVSQAQLNIHLDQIHSNSNSDQSKGNNQESPSSPKLLQQAQQSESNLTSENKKGSSNDSLKSSASGQGNFTRSSMDGPSGYLAIPKDVLETRTSTQSLTNTSQRSSVNSTSSDGSRTSGFSSSNSTQVDQAFHQFLETDLQNNAEIVFYTEVSHWKDQTRINISPEMEKRAKEIYEKYLTGKVSLPISKGTMERLIVSFSQQDPKARMKPDIFDQAQIEVMEVIQREQFPKFMKSMFYLALDVYQRGSEYQIKPEIWERFKEAAAANDWTKVGTKKEVDIFVKTYPGQKMTCVKGTGIIHQTKAQLARIATDVKLREKWDMMYGDATIVENLDSRSAVCRYMFKSPKWAPMLRDHDFVILRTSKEESDGTVLVLSTSIFHPDPKAQAVKGIVRGEIDLAGFIIKPISLSSCKVDYLVQVDLKDNLVPAVIANIFVNKRALIIEKIRKFVKKYPNWYSEM